MAQTHIAVRQNRVLAVPRCPIRRNTRGRLPKDMRGKPRNSNRRKQKKTRVVQHKAKMSHPRPAAPANECIACRLMPTRRAEPDAAKAAETLRNHEIRQALARMMWNALRMMRRHHRAEPPRRNPVRNRLQRHLAQILQLRLKADIREGRQRPTRRRLPLPCRQRKAQLRRKPRQNLARRRNARITPRVAPALPLAQLCGKPRTAGAFRRNRLPEPLQRVRGKLS